MLLDQVNRQLSSLHTGHSNVRTYNKDHNIMKQNAGALAWLGTSLSHILGFPTFPQIKPIMHPWVWVSPAHNRMLIYSTYIIIYNCT